mmetsp:Transcript_85218/g.264793  ORF Transcript_85218/g.264793 Transcript_85218/m.264793 type:complete len:215 (+) Transcript_85218:838-1482(+)
MPNCSSQLPREPEYEHGSHKCKRAHTAHNGMHCTARTKLLPAVEEHKAHQQVHQDGKVPSPLPPGPHPADARRQLLHEDAAAACRQAGGEVARANDGPCAPLTLPLIAINADRGEARPEPLAEAARRHLRGLEAQGPCTAPGLLPGGGVLLRLQPEAQLCKRPGPPRRPVGLLRAEARGQPGRQRPHLAIAGGGAKLQCLLLAIRRSQGGIADR